MISLIDLGRYPKSGLHLLNFKIDMENGFLFFTILVSGPSVLLGSSPITHMLLGIPL